MMPSMMSGSAFLWVAPFVLFCLAFLVAFIWLLVQWLKSRRSLLPQHEREPHNEYRAYEQGYQPEQWTPETSQEGDQRSSYSQHEQPQAQYQYQEME